MTAERIASLKEHFERSDTNKDGFISLDEAKAAFETTGKVWGFKQQKFYDSCDTNGDGKTSLEEFLAKISK